METAVHLRVRQTEQDDPEFLALVSGVLNTTAEHYNPDDIYLVQIKGWFGDKWLRFPFGLGSLVSVRLFESLIVPPFHPQRVRSETHFRRVEPGKLLYQEGDVRCIHMPYETHQETRYRPLHRLTRSGVFIWYSSDTKTSDRASLMLYRIQEDHERAWYASLLKSGEWKISLARGISPQEIMQLASRP